MKKSMILKSLLSVVYAPPGNVFGQGTLSNDKLVHNYPFAPSEGTVNRMEKEYRSEMCLSDFWDLQPVSLSSTYVQGKGVAPELSLPGEKQWSDIRIKIPSPWSINAFANRNLEGPDHRNYPSYSKEWKQVKMARMRGKVTIPTEWAGQQIKLYFKAVAGVMEVYINKEKVGENFNLFLPFSIDTTNKVNAGETVEVLVGVRSQSLFEDNSTIGRRIVPAGSMWGYHTADIRQDVYLLALPKVYAEDIFVKPSVPKGILELGVIVQNNTAREADPQVQGDINEWVSSAETDVSSAPIPVWKLGKKVLEVKAAKVSVPANASTKVVLQVPVLDELRFWTPEYPNLYALLPSLKVKKQNLDVEHERFGWREWTLNGTVQCLSGKSYQLRGDSWHFMGIPQVTRRYAWTWFTAIKGMDGDAVCPHTQVYPRFYLDTADEMGICVLNETANWASDGGPELNSKLLWKASKEHLTRFVLRDRNHVSVLGWGISNENKPVILHVFNRLELMAPQKKAWEEWRNIVWLNNPTRPWVSSDGEDDGDGILPVTVRYYGDMNSMKRWIEMGKPWGTGEHNTAHYGTPEQVAKCNGERTYESQLGRMEGPTNECYHLLANQRSTDASYSTVFNMAWYLLKPLSLGKKDLTSEPDISRDGVFLTEYKEGVPDVQPERVGPYCITFNPGYDPNLPLYDPWSMYDAMRATDIPKHPAWPSYAEIDEKQYEAPEVFPPEKHKEIIFIGRRDSKLKGIMDAQGVKFSAKIITPAQMIYIVDGTYDLPAAEKKSMLANLAKGADAWIWGLTPEMVDIYNEIPPLSIMLDSLKRSSLLPAQKSWIRGLNNSDLYFCELQRADASEYFLKGALVEEGEVLLSACKTDWRAWNKRLEEIETVGTIRSEYECTVATPVFVRYQNGASCLYVSTPKELTNSEKGYNILRAILKSVGIDCQEIEVKSNELLFLRDNQLVFPAAVRDKLIKTIMGRTLDIHVFSPRPLDDSLIESNMPKLTSVARIKKYQLSINDEVYVAAEKNRYEVTYRELPPLQGWNKISIATGENDKSEFSGSFRCDSGNELLPSLKASFVNPEAK